MSKQVRDTDPLKVERRMMWALFGLLMFAAVGSFFALLENTIWSSSTKCIRVSCDVLEDMVIPAGVKLAPGSVEWEKLNCRYVDDKCEGK